MNIQDELQKIHHKFGVSEMANYKIEQFIESLIEKDRKEQLILNGVVLSACSFYVSGNDTSANCINCGKPRHIH